MKKPQALPRHKQTTPAPAPTGPQSPPSAAPGMVLPTLSPVRPVHPGVSFASITTGIRFSLLQDPQDEDPLLDDDDAAPVPSNPTRPPQYRRKPRHRLQGSLAPPSTPTPLDHDEGFTHFSVAADVHQPSTPSSHQGQGTGNPPRATTPLRPSPSMSSTPPVLPSDAPCPTASTNPPLRTEAVLSRVFTLLWKGYQLYQTGTSVPEILASLWPTLSMLITSLFQ